MTIKRWLFEWLRSQAHNDQPRTVDLDILLAKSRDRCEYPDPVCSQCLAEGLALLFQNKITETHILTEYIQNMYLRRSSIAELPNVPVRDDVAFKCPKCRHTAHFGNPLTRNEAKQEIQERGSTRLMTPTYNYQDRKDEELKKRLIALGYYY